jgi:thiamine-monophosphate kinase
VTEADFIAALRTLPLHPGAHELRDDSATIGGLTVTTDTIVEGIHFLSDDPPGDIAWKLLAVNLSDLAAKGASIEGALLNYPLSNDGWDRAFLDGLRAALETFGCPLIGGDTVSLPANAPRVLTVTAIGRDAASPLRSGAQAGDGLWVTGTIGDAGAGLRIAQGALGPQALLARYRRPMPRLADGLRLAPLVHAMMDVSDGVLIDAGRMATASGLAVAIELAALPLSLDYLAFAGADFAAHLAAATAGDDYELLFALPGGDEPPVGAFPVGRFDAGNGITLTWRGAPVPLPASLGFQH